MYDADGKISADFPSPLQDDFLVQIDIFPGCHFN